MRCTFCIFLSVINLTIGFEVHLQKKSNQPTVCCVTCGSVLRRTPATVVARLTKAGRVEVVVQLPVPVSLRTQSRTATATLDPGLTLSRPAKRAKVAHEVTIMFRRA